MLSKTTATRAIADADWGWGLTVLSWNRVPSLYDIEAWCHNPE
jgi:hypothetical protein